MGTPLKEIKNMSSDSDCEQPIDVKEIIFRMKEINCTWNDIGYVVGKSKSAVRKIHQRYALIRGLPPKVIMPQRMIDNQMGREIKQYIKANRIRTIEDIRGHLEKTYRASKRIPSEKTIRVWLNDNCFDLKKASKKVLLHPRNVAKRFSFAQNMFEKPDQFWDRVIWSDETTVRSHSAKNEIWYWNHSSFEYMDPIINGQVQGGGCSVMFWGCFTAAGTGPLVAIEGNVNAAKYINLLEEHLIPAYEGIRDDMGDEGMIFMQDNAPCHKAKSVMDFLAKNHIETLNWPPQSPDLNPIENIWSLVKRRRIKKYGRPKSQAELIDQVMDIWDNLEPDLLVNYAQSAKRRMSACLESQGKHTKY